MLERRSSGKINCQNLGNAMSEKIKNFFFSEERAGMGWDQDPILSFFFPSKKNLFVWKRSVE